MPDTKVSALSAGTPAALADALPIARAGASYKLTVQDILTALTLLASGAPAQGADEILVQRTAGAAGAKKLTVTDLATYFGAVRRNLVINGNFDIAQRASTYNLTTGVAYGSADRWAFKMAGTAAGIANVVDAQAQGYVGFKNCLKLGRTAGSAQVGVISAQTCWETIESTRFQGKNVVLRLAIKAGANFSGANLAIKLFSGKGTDQSLASMEAGTWTTQATQINAAQGIGAVADYSFTATLPNDITQLGMQISYTPTGVAGADDNVYVTGIDITEGTVAPIREFRPIEIELALCQRYYEKSFPQGTAVPSASVNQGQMYFAAGAAIANGAIVGPVCFKVTKRAVPTVTTYSYVANTTNVLSTAAGVDLAAGSGTPASIGDSGFVVSNNSGANITPTSGGFLMHWAASAEL